MPKGSTGAYHDDIFGEATEEKAGSNDATLCNASSRLTGLADLSCNRMDGSWNKL